MELAAVQHGGALVTASDIRTTLFRRAVALLDDVQTGLHEFAFGAQLSTDGDGAAAEGQLRTASTSVTGRESGGAVVPHSGGGGFVERLLTALVSGRTNSTRRAVDSVVQVHKEIEGILRTFEREFPAPDPSFAGDRALGSRPQGAEAQVPEEVLRVAAATTAAAARFRLRAAEAAKGALQSYGSATKQAATAAQATARALELQVAAQQHSESGNLAQALEAIREANRLRDESVDAASRGRQLQQDYVRQRREAQEAHAQADAAMRHAYSLERDALKASSTAAAQDLFRCQEQSASLSRQGEALREREESWDAEADSAVAKAQQAQRNADEEMAAGNYDVGKALMEEAVRAQEHAGYARAQAAAARDAYQRLAPDMDAARERAEGAEQLVQQLEERKAQLQDAVGKQLTDRRQEEFDGLEALCGSAEEATALHENLVQVYEERLTEDQQKCEALRSQGNTEDAHKLSVHISTWRELLDMARQNRDASRSDATSARARLEQLKTLALAATEDVLPVDVEHDEGFERLRDATERSARATQALELLGREFSSTPPGGIGAEGASSSGESLLLLTELHRQKTSKLAQQLDDERRLLSSGDTGRSLPPQGQVEALMDSMAVSHLVETLEATRLLQLWKHHSDEATAGADELRETWSAMERAANTHADDAVRLEEQALSLEQAGEAEQAAATMARADELHCKAEKLRVEADKAKAALAARERAGAEAQTQQAVLVQGLQEVERAAMRLHAELADMGYTVLDEGARQLEAPAPHSDALQPQTRPASRSGLDEMASTLIQDEYTVMMASPSMLSRTSSIATRGVPGVQATRGEAKPAFSHTFRHLEVADWDQGNRESGGDEADATAGDRLAVPAELCDTYERSRDDSGEEQLRHTSGLLSSTNSKVEVSVLKADTLLSDLVRELDAHTAVGAPSLNDISLADLTAAITTLRSAELDEAALSSVASSSAAFHAQALDWASVADWYQQADVERLARLEKAIAGIATLPEVHPVAFEVAEEARRRCSAAIEGSQFLVEAFAVYADCHLQLESGIASYRRAHTVALAAEDEARSAQANLSTAQAQVVAMQSEGADTSQRLDQMEADIAEHEAQGRTTQALMMRFELQRLQNVRHDASEHVEQLQAACQDAQRATATAQSRAAHARQAAEAYPRILEVLAESTQEAGAAVRHAVGAYTHASMAIAIGAEFGLIRLGSRQGNTASSSGDVQRHIDEAERGVACAKHAITAAKRLCKTAEDTAASLAAPHAEQVQQSKLSAAGTVKQSSGQFQTVANVAESASPLEPMINPRHPDRSAPEDSRAQAAAAAADSIPEGIKGSKAVDAVMALEDEIVDLGIRHAEELSRLQSTHGLNIDSDDAAELELQHLLHAAEGQLATTRAEQAASQGRTPAEVQASHDRLQLHEQHVATLSHSIAASGELRTARNALQRTHMSLEHVELEAANCERLMPLLQKMADHCDSEARKVESLLNDPTSQGDREALEEQLSWWRRRAQQAVHQEHECGERLEASRMQARQLAGQAAMEKQAVLLREEWLNQMQGSAASAAATKDWERRLHAARSDVEQLGRPLKEQASKVEAAEALVQSMSNAATQHRRQAADLTRQAEGQREAAQRLAAAGERLEADAAKSVAASLQEQADGLLAQASRIQSDARRHELEAAGQQRALSAAQEEACAKEEILSQIQAAHRLSVATFQARSKASFKLRDAVERHADVVEQQASLVGVEKALVGMEAQMSGNTGGPVRPDELAAQMINVVRTKQHASSLRAALRTTQQEVEQDRNAAMAALREATKAEEQLAEVQATLQQLEGSRQDTGTVSTASAFNSGSRLNSSNPETHEKVLPALPRPAFSQPVRLHVADPNGEDPGDTTGFLEASGRVTQGARRVELPLGRTSGIDASGATSDRSCRDSAKDVDVSGGVKLHRNFDDHAEQMGPSNPIGSRGDLSGASAEAAIVSPMPDLMDTMARLGSSNIASRSLSRSASHREPAMMAAGVNAPLSRLRHATPRQASLLGVSSGSAPCLSPTGQQGTGMIVRASLGEDVVDIPRRNPWAWSDGEPGENMDSSQPPSLRQASTFSDLKAVARVPSLSVAQSLPSPRMARAHLAQDVPVDRGPGTAGALLEKVATRQLRPLSNIKLPGSRHADGGRARNLHTDSSIPGSIDVTQRDQTGHAGGDDDGQDARSGSSSNHDDVSLSNFGDRNLRRPSQGGEMGQRDSPEEEQDVEPDTKMYRTVKHRLQDLESRIMNLRRQGDTANTAVDILARKQEQLRMDMPTLQGDEDEQQAALLEHGDAMIRLKETEGSVCYKQADVLEEEAAAAQDALHYATVDARLRRESQRLEQRCTALTDRAQAKAMEAQGFEADAAEAAECAALAAGRAGRQLRSYNVTLEQESLAKFAEAQQRWQQAATGRASHARAEAARLANLARTAFAEKALVEKRSICNKALYMSAVELAHAYDEAAKVAAQSQHYRLAGLKAATDSVGSRVQQIEAARESSAAAMRQRSSRLVANRSQLPPIEVLDSIAELSEATADAIDHCLEEIVGTSSDAITVVRRRMQNISAVLQLYNESHDSGDHLEGEGRDTPAWDTSQQQQQRRRQADKRQAQISATEASVAALDRACTLAAELRALCLDLAATHGSLCDTQTEPSLLQAQQMGHKNAQMVLDQEEMHRLRQNLEGLQVQMLMTRDQLGASLQAVEYGQAAAQLVAAHGELRCAASSASESADQLESTLEVRQQALVMLRSHMESVLQEGQLLRADGNALQAAAADEAAKRLAGDALDADGQVASLQQEAQLKRHEEAMSRTAAEELQRVAEGSSELEVLLLRIVEQQQLAKTSSHEAAELGERQRRSQQECKTQQRLAEDASRRAELLQHEFLQCRTDLDFAGADERQVMAQQCRASAREHSAAAAAAKKDAASAGAQLAPLTHYRDLLMREIKLLHSAAEHLQEALAGMRDKHHLVRRLRDAEYEKRHAPRADGEADSKMDDVKVLQTQIAASTSTIQHHLSSKASYVLAADHMALAASSMGRAAACTQQADTAMQDLTRERIVGAANGAAGQSSHPSSAPKEPTMLTAERSAAGSVEEDSHACNSSVAVSSAGAAQAQNWQTSQADLRHRCLRGAVSALRAIAAAGEAASDARKLQVVLADQAASLVSDLAAKILEAEANADEAAKLEAANAAGRGGAGAGEEEDEDSLKEKLMVNALLQQAETYRGQATALQGRIAELQKEAQEADSAATAHETSLADLQSEHRHALAALDLTARIAACREQEAEARAAARSLSAEVTQLEREAGGMEAKAQQLRLQLTSASHAASSEDVANLMVVLQTMGTKAAGHRALQAARQRELADREAEAERSGREAELLVARAQGVLQAGETQGLVRQSNERTKQLQSELSAAGAARMDCQQMLDELHRQQSELLDASGDVHNMAVGHGTPSVKETAVTLASAYGAGASREVQQAAATQTSIGLAEQMLEAHATREGVLRRAIAACEAVRDRHQEMLRHQEQLQQQAEWRLRLEHLHEELSAAATEHTNKARELRAASAPAAGGGRNSGTGGGDSASGRAPGDKGNGSTEDVKAQAAAIRLASEAAQNYTLAEAEERLAVRATSLAAKVAKQAHRLSALSDLVAPVAARLAAASSTAVSVARLQMQAAAVAREQGSELASMHDALRSVGSLAADVGALMAAADRHLRAGHGLEAASARGRAAALQETLAKELGVARGCRERLAALAAKLVEADQQLELAAARAAQMARPAAVSLSLAEYAHHACGLHFAVAQRQQAILSRVKQASDCARRANVARREHRASEDAAAHLAKTSKGDGSAIVQRAAVVLERSMTTAEEESRLLVAQAVQEEDGAEADTVQAALYGELASLSVRLLDQLQEQSMAEEEAERLQGTVAGVQRSLEEARVVLAQRRGDMQVINERIEQQRAEALLLRKRGHEAQAAVRTEAAEMLAAELADAAEDAMRVERQVTALEQRQMVLASLHAKSEAGVALLGQLARLCGAAVSHLLDGRAAHERHGEFARNAAVAAVELAKEEAVLTDVEDRVRERQDAAHTLVELRAAQQQKQAIAAALGRPAHDEDEDDGAGGAEEEDQQLQESILAGAALLMARRQRGEAVQRAMACRARVAKEELALEASQLRVTQARQRADDAQRLLGELLSLLEGLRGAVADTLSDLIHPHDTLETSSANADPLEVPSLRAAAAHGSAAPPIRTEEQRHGLLASAQLQSVTLQALAEAAARFVESLDAAAAAEAARIAMQEASAAATAAREAADVQHSANEDAREAAEEAGVVVQVRRLNWQHHRNADGSQLLIANDHRTSGDGNAAGNKRGWGEEGGISEANAGQVEVDRALHEAAYMDAVAAQQQKLAVCLDQQRSLLSRGSDCLLAMARYGIAAQRGATPGSPTRSGGGVAMSAAEAATLLATCKHLARQHAAIMALVPPLDRCRRSEEYLRDSVDCVQQAWALRQQALHLLSPTIPTAAGTHGSAIHGGGGGVQRVQGWVPAAREGDDDDASASQRHAQLLFDEERLVAEVAELDEVAMELLSRASEEAAAFGAVWAATVGAGETGEAAARWLEAATAAEGAAAVAQLSPTAAMRSVRQWAAEVQHGEGNTFRQVVSPTRHVPYVESSKRTGADGEANGTGASPSVARVWRDTVSPSMSDADRGSTYPVISGVMTSPRAASPRPGRSQPQSTPSPNSSDHQASARGGSDGSIDQELIAMAEAAVARAKAAAAAVAARWQSNSTTSAEALPTTAPGVQPDYRRSTLPSAKRTSSGAGLEDRTVAAQRLQTSGTGGTMASATAPGSAAVKVPDQTGNRETSAPAARPDTAHAAYGQPQPVPGAQLQLQQQTPHFGSHVSSSIYTPRPAPSAANPPPSEGQTPQLQSPPDRAASPPLGTVGSPPSSVSTALPSVYVAQRSGGVAPGAATQLAHLQSDPHGAPLSSWRQNARTTQTHAAPTGAAAVVPSPAPQTKLRAQPAKALPPPLIQRPEIADLPRVPLPDDLPPAAAAALAELWSRACGHYQRLQHMHDGAIQQMEQQWDLCQVKLQTLQAEEAQARENGKVAEADAAAAAAARWHDRADNLHASMQTHGSEGARMNAHVRRAIAMCERLHLAAAGPRGYSAVTNRAAGRQVAGLAQLHAMQHLVPALPSSVLAGSGVWQALDGVREELSSTSARLTTTAARLQQHSQKLFAKAASHSDKLKQLRLGGAEDATTHAALLSKSHGHAQKAASLGERAVELTEGSQSLSRAGDVMSTEAAALAGLGERLRRAAEGELAAQRALVSAMDLLLCEAMQAVLYGEGLQSEGPEGARAPLEAALGSERGRGPLGFDELLAACEPPGHCLAAARRAARLGEDLAADAARLVQGVKEALGERMAAFGRGLEAAAVALSAQAAALSAARQPLLAQAEAAALCTARAEAKAASHRSAGDVTAADKYHQAGDGWARQAEKQRAEAMAAAAMAEECLTCGSQLKDLVPLLRPLEAELDAYLDEQLEAWAAAAMARVHTPGVWG